ARAQVAASFLTTTGTVLGPEPQYWAKSNKDNHWHPISEFKQQGREIIAVRPDGSPCTSPTSTTWRSPTCTQCADRTSGPVHGPACVQAEDRAASRPLRPHSDDPPRWSLAVVLRRLNSAVTVVGDGADGAAVDLLGRPVLPASAGQGRRPARVDLAESDGEPGSHITLWERRRMASSSTTPSTHRAAAGHVHRRPYGPPDQRAVPARTPWTSAPPSPLPGNSTGFPTACCCSASRRQTPATAPAVATAVDRMVEHIVAAVRELRPEVAPSRDHRPEPARGIREGLK
ncbi:hypothetical protein AB0J72_58875, partial [Dactylosporangium sp. NPDC049742]|uniref:hypothetical protein n=1 Tax=Dactylosporangium sp. NPDC049742 TaxID=3154737 RepID=UPI00343C1F13